MRAVAASHRIGVLQIGEAALVAAVAADHRQAAFATCAQLVDTIKARLPVWKHQFFDDGTEEWVGSASLERQGPPNRQLMTEGCASESSASFPCTSAPESLPTVAGCSRRRRVLWFGGRVGGSRRHRVCGPAAGRQQAGASAAGPPAEPAPGLPAAEEAAGGRLAEERPPAVGRQRGGGAVDTGRVQRRV